MNNTHLVSLCDVFKLGTPISEPERIHGGLLHIMWRIRTEKASYAIKQLSPNIDLTNIYKVHRNSSLLDKKK